MRLVKLVKLVHTFMLQNQRLKKTLYRIDFNGNLYRIILDGLAQKVMNFDVFQSSDLDFVACKNLPCQILFLWKVLDFVESRILAGRAGFDLVIGPFGTWPWGPLQNRGAQQGPPNCKGDFWPCFEVIGRKTYYKIKGQDLKSLRSLMKSGPITKSKGVFGYQIVWFWDDSDFFALN